MPVFVRRLFLGLVLALPLGPACAAPPHYALPYPERPVALLRPGGATYLVTEHSVLRLEGRRLVPRFHSDVAIRCALVADTALLLGTQQGVVRLGTATFRPHGLGLPGPDARPSISALFRDAVGALWVGTDGYGAFRQTGGGFRTELSVPAISDGAATADSAVWLATNTGLYRQQHGTWTRFNEEGVANHEIPDNLVERLLPDQRGNLWVLMSEGVTVFDTRPRRPAAASAELPTATFIGRPGNTVSGLAYLRGQGYLFATATGLLLLPAAPTAPLGRPVSTTDRVEPRRALLPLPAPGGPVVLLQPGPHRRLWLVSNSEITVLSECAARRQVRAQGRAPAGRAAL